MISSRALSARTARWMTDLAEFLEPLTIGIAVAKTIGSVVVNPADISSQVILAAILAAIVWNPLTSFLGLPSSSFHALVGGLIGAVVLAAGIHAMQLTTLIKYYSHCFYHCWLDLFSVSSS